MQDLGNKLLIYLAGCYFIWCLGVEDQAIIAVTLSLLFSCLCSFFKDTIVCGILVLLSSLLCLFIPPLLSFLPLFIYDAIYRRQNLVLAAGALVGIRVFLWFPQVLFFPFLLLFAVTFLLAGYSRKNQGLFSAFSLNFGNFTICSRIRPGFAKGPGPGARLPRRAKNLYSQPDDAGRARDFSALQGKNPQQYLVYCKDFSRR